ncbi:MAG: pyridoxamine 5'-phosphate oxidase family protein [Pseudomonadota bacterium]
MEEPWGDLAATLKAVWIRLGRATKDRRSPWRFPMLATIGAAGPEVRTVVLRAADRQAAMLQIYSDARTAKVTEIADDPRVSLALWDPGARLQLRLRAAAETLTGDAVASQWAALPPVARRDYAAIAVPGAPLVGEDLRDAAPDARYFAVISLRVHEIDTVHLGREAHRRALFQGSDDWAGTWLQP